MGPRQVVATIPLDSLLDVITGRRTVCNVPEGAKIVSAWFDGFSLAGSLPETEVGGRIPVMKFHAPWKEPKPRLSSAQLQIEAGTDGEAKTKSI